MQAPLVERHLSRRYSIWSTWFEASLVAVASHSVLYAGFHLLKIFVSGLADEVFPITPIGRRRRGGGGGGVEEEEED
jgi:hypothetical protein